MDDKDKKIAKLTKQLESLKMCGNCKYMDIFMDDGSVCLHGIYGLYGVPTDKTGYCNNWELDKK